MTTLLEIALNWSDKILVKYVPNPRGKLSVHNNSPYKHDIKNTKRSSYDTLAYILSYDDLYDLIHLYL